MKFVKFGVALLLAPFLAGSLRFAWEVLRLSWESWPWPEVGCFVLGFSFWLSVYMALPRPTWVYVFGHECTHALAVLLSMGKVSEFKVSSEGGHVVSDKMSAWIALAPYLVPFYPLIAGVLWLVVRWFFPVTGEYVWAFLIFWGMSWGFHLSFTLSVMKKGQTDLSSQGYVFSLLIIALFNLWMVTIFLWVWLKPFEWRDGFDLICSYTRYEYLRIAGWAVTAAGWITK